MIKLFITATDTDTGKTYVSQALTSALVSKKYRVAVYKPISAGCDLVNHQGEEILINEDAHLLMQQSNCQQSISEINPIAFQPAIAPHIAASLIDRKISINEISAGYENVLSNNSDFVITEGAGGWRLPLGSGLFLSEFVKQTKQKVILVVNMKLGCLNHAVLSYESILADGLQCIGWVANCLEPMHYLDENIAELKTLIQAPLIAQLGFEPDIKKAATKLDLTSISTLL